MIRPGLFVSRTVFRTITVSRSSLLKKLTELEHGKIMPPYKRDDVTRLTLSHTITSL